MKTRRGLNKKLLRGFSIAACLAVPGNPEIYRKCQVKMRVSLLCSFHHTFKAFQTVCRYARKITRRKIYGHFFRFFTVTDKMSTLLQKAMLRKNTFKNNQNNCLNNLMLISQFSISDDDAESGLSCPNRWKKSSIDSSSARCFRTELSTRLSS